jgi:hypothetical protein
MVRVIFVAFTTILVLNICQLAAPAPVWIIWLVENLIQAIIIGIMLFVYRPRGPTVDMFLQTHPPVNREGAELVFLDDLKTFTVKDQDGYLKEWKEGMELPQEPYICSGSPYKVKSEKDDLHAPITLEVDGM